MRTTIATLLGISLLLAGCSNQNDQRLVGVWQIAKPDAVTKKVSGQKESAGEAVSSPQMTVEFFRSGTLTTTTRMGKIDSVKTGTWNTLSTDRDSDNIQIQCQIGMQQTTHEIVLNDTDSIRWIPPNMAGTKQEVLFVRVKK